MTGFREYFKNWWNSIQLESRVIQHWMLPGMLKSPEVSRPGLQPKRPTEAAVKAYQAGLPIPVIFAKPKCWEMVWPSDSVKPYPDGHSWAELFCWKSEYLLRVYRKGVLVHEKRSYWLRDIDFGIVATEVFGKRKDT